jgi:hypothetical protein
MRAAKRPGAGAVDQIAASLTLLAMTVGGGLVPLATVGGGLVLLATTVGGGLVPLAVTVDGIGS